MNHSEVAIGLSLLDDSLWCGLWQHPGVFVSYEGRVASTRSGKVRLLRGSRRGKYLSLGFKGGPYVHRVACELFHGQAPIGCEVRHLDGNRDNNAAPNLAWGTRADNAADKARHGTDPSGERNGMARLTSAQVESMRLLRDRSGCSYRVIGQRYGVSTMTAYRAVQRQSWK